MSAFNLLQIPNEDTDINSNSITHYNYNEKIPTALDITSHENSSPPESRNNYYYVPLANGLVCQTAYILEHIFKFLSNDHLKICRLVNKLWNTESCRVLQQTTYVNIIEFEKNNFPVFFENVKLSSTEDLPSPFKRYKVYAERLGKNLLNYLLSSKIQTAVVLLHLKRSVRLPLVHKVIVKNYEFLKIFHLCIKGCIDKDSTSVRPELPLLSAMEEFSFTDSDIGPSSSRNGWIPFLCEIIRMSPHLSTLIGHTKDEHVFLYIFQNTNLKQIKKLLITNFTRKHLQILAALRLPNLQSLSFPSHNHHDTNVLNQFQENELRPELLLSLITNYSETIEHLNMSWVSNVNAPGPAVVAEDAEFPFCLKLEKLVISDWNRSLETFNELRMPNLKYIYLRNFVESLEEFGTSPHYGVRNFGLECDGLENEPEPTGQEIDEEHISFFEYIQGQFPSLTSLELTMAISNELCTAILRIFPNLKRLVLNTKFSIGEHLFTGVNRLTLKRYLRNRGLTFGHQPLPDMDLDDVVCTPSLRSLMCLQELVLGGDNNYNGMLVSNNAIQFGIAKMPALKSLQLNWNMELSVNIVSEHLSHLDEVIVNNADSFEPFGILSSLKQRLPQVQLITKKFCCPLNLRKFFT